MAYDVLVGDVQYDLATISGWRSFRERVESTDKKTLKSLRELIDQGETEDVNGLVEDLELFLENDSLDDANRDIAEGLIESIETNPDADSVIISDGMTDADVEDDWYVSGDDDDNSPSPGTESHDPQSALECRRLTEVMRRKAGLEAASRIYP